MQKASWHFLNGVDKYVSSFRELEYSNMELTEGNNAVDYVVDMHTAIYKLFAWETLMQTWGILYVGKTLKCRGESSKWMQQDNEE